jgi:hypothetical protein
VRISRTVASLALVVALAGFLSQIAVQHFMLPYAIDGQYFQPWSSEHMVQTVSIQDLRASPVQSLANLHIQPPALDTIRAILAQMWPASDPNAMLRGVDRSLYVLWAALYGVLGGLVFLWLTQLTRPGYALGGALVLLAHPATIFYATLLEATLLTSVLVLAMYYALWRLRADPNRSIVPFTLSVLALFFTRSIFDWPALVVFATCLALVRVPRRRVLAFVLVCGAVAGLYLGKQYYKFGLVSTSSLGGLNLTHSIGLRDTDYFRYLPAGGSNDASDASLPGVLTRRTKLDGAPNLNHIGYLGMNRHLLDLYRQRVAAMPLEALLRNYRQNLRLYLLPSTWFTVHVIADRLPWRTAYNDVFSFPVLPALVIIAGLAWFFAMRSRRDKTPDYGPAFAMVLPALCIALVSIVGDKGENMRFKFFLEPMLFVFIAAQLHAAAGPLWRKWRARTPSDTATRR